MISFLVILYFLGGLFFYITFTNFSRNGFLFFFTTGYVSAGHYPTILFFFEEWFHYSLEFNFFFFWTGYQVFVDLFFDPVLANIVLWIVFIITGIQVVYEPIRARKLPLSCFFVYTFLYWKIVLDWCLIIFFFKFATIIWFIAVFILFFLVFKTFIY